MNLTLIITVILILLFILLSGYFCVRCKIRLKEFKRHNIVIPFNEIKHTLKTGDIISYNTCSTLGILIRKYLNCSMNHVSMVVKQDGQLFALDLDKNIFHDSAQLLPLESLLNTQEIFGLIPVSQEIPITKHQVREYLKIGYQFNLFKSFQNHKTKKVCSTIISQIYKDFNLLPSDKPHYEYKPCDFLNDDTIIYFDYHYPNKSRH